MSPATTTNVQLSPSNSVSSSTSQNEEAPLVNMRIERPMGDSEASYYLPSREDGANDMLLHLSCHAPRHVFNPERVRIVWALCRLQHPLLSSKVDMRSYTDLRFVYEYPRSVEDALANAEDNLEFRSQDRDDLINDFTNGRRTLSGDRSSYVFISCEGAQNASSSPDTPLNYHIVLAILHSLGDGTGFHQLANDIFALLGGPLTNHELLLQLSAKHQQGLVKLQHKTLALPAPLEGRLPPPGGRFKQVVSQLDFKRWQDKYIGGHVFPRRTLGPRRSITRVVSLDEETTKDIMKRCKSQGVSLNSAIFALCGIAWAKTMGGQNEALPIMMYSAIDVRPFLWKEAVGNDSYLYLAISYFNIVLPGFLPRSGNLARTFWARAKSARKQIIQSAKHPMVRSRIREMARDRCARSRAFAKEDDERAAGTWVPPPPPPRPPPAKPTPPPSAALVGLSLIGDLDNAYKHATYGDLRLYDITLATRMRAGAMLIFGYTFLGKLCISLGYDENGFERDVVDRFWHNVSTSAEELLAGVKFRARL